MTKSPHPSSVDKGELLPVTQADRDAAADAQLARGLGRGEAIRLREGDADDHWLVQAFARHRISHCLPGDVGMREAKLQADVKLVAEAVAQRCSTGSNKDGSPKAPARYATIWQAARLGALEYAKMTRQDHFVDVTGMIATEHRIDMANVGEALMEALRDASGCEFMKTWAPADCPTEIVFDLLNALDEAKAAALTPSALSVEPVQKLHELPEGHRWCRHCEQKDPHCSVCEGVGYLPDTAARKGTP